MNLQEKIQKMMVDFNRNFDQLAMKCYRRHQKSCGVKNTDMRIIDHQNNERIVRDIMCSKCGLKDTQYVELSKIE